MATLNMDGPQPKTKDATVYLFRGLMIVGYLPPKKYLVPFYIWTIFINAFVTVYLPIGFLLSFLTRISAFSPSEFLTSLQISVNCFGCSLKMVVLLFLYRRLIKGTKFMDKMDLRVSEPEDKEQIRKIVAFSNRSHIMFAVLFLSYASSTFLTAVTNGRPPYQVYNPFMEWTESPLYFVIQAGVEYFMIDFHCYQQALLDSYPVIYITIIRTHLHILTRRIRKLGQDSKLSSDERYEALVQCVLDHKNIMDLYNIFSPVISGTMFVQFLIIGLILGITTIHIILFADILAMIASMFYVASILAETFPCSFLANSLMDDSDSISLAIFHSDWPSEEPRYKQMIAFFLQHTQKTLILTAMKIFPITMNSNINNLAFFLLYVLATMLTSNVTLKFTIDGLSAQKNALSNEFTCQLLSRILERRTSYSDVMLFLHNPLEFINIHLEDNYDLFKQQKPSLMKTIVTLMANKSVVKFAFSVYTMMKQMDFGQNLKDSVTGEKEP